MAKSKGKGRGKTTKVKGLSVVSGRKSNNAAATLTAQKAGQFGTRSAAGIAALASISSKVSSGKNISISKGGAFGSVGDISKSDFTSPTTYINRGATVNIGGKTVKLVASDDGRGNAIAVPDYSGMGSYGKIRTSYRDDLGRLAGVDSDFGVGTSGNITISNEYGTTKISSQVFNKYLKNQTGLGIPWTGNAEKAVIDFGKIIQPENLKRNVITYKIQDDLISDYRKLYDERESLVPQYNMFRSEALAIESLFEKGQGTDALLKRHSDLISQLEIYSEKINTIDKKQGQKLDIITDMEKAVQRDIDKYVFANADNVGIMRYGDLLAQQTNFIVNNLEKAEEKQKQNEIKYEDAKKIAEKPITYTFGDIISTSPIDDFAISEDLYRQFEERFQKQQSAVDAFLTKYNTFTQKAIDKTYTKENPENQTFLSQFIDVGDLQLTLTPPKEDEVGVSYLKDKVESEGSVIYFKFKNPESTTDEEKKVAMMGLDEYSKSRHDSWLEDVTRTYQTKKSEWVPIKQKHTENIQRFYRTNVSNLNRLVLKRHISYKEYAEGLAEAEKQKIQMLEELEKEEKPFSEMVETEKQNIIDAPIVADVEKKVDTRIISEFENVQKESDSLDELQTSLDNKFKELEMKRQRDELTKTFSGGSIPRSKWFPNRSRFRPSGRRY